MKLLQRTKSRVMCLAGCWWIFNPRRLDAGDRPRQSVDQLHLRCHALRGRVHGPPVQMNVRRRHPHRRRRRPCAVLRFARSRRPPNHYRSTSASTTGPLVTHFLLVIFSPASSTVVHVLLVATDAPHELRVFLDRRARRFQGLQGQRLGADLDVDLDRRAERSP